MDRTAAPAIGDRPLPRSISNKSPAFYGLREDDLAQCVLCGTCVQVCPTYLVSGDELESPRGRIYLIRAASEGRISTDGTFLKHIFLCLACRACETACSSGVRFGRMMDAARAQALRSRPDFPLHRAVRWLVFRHLLPRRGALKLLTAVLGGYQRSGLQLLVRRLRLLRWSARLAAAEALLPEIPNSFFEIPSRETVSAAGNRRFRVGFIWGCVSPYLLPEQNRASLSVLARNGCEVVIPRSQACCGALASHLGEREAAKALARRNLEAFGRVELDAVVTNAAGCGSALKEYGALLADDVRFAAEAARFSKKVRDINEFLLEIGLSGNRGPVRERVAYQHACHLLHGQGLRSEALDILRSIPELELIEMENSDRCCGSAGIYNIIQPETARKIGSLKVSSIRAAETDCVAVSNPGCVLHLKSMLNGHRIPVWHPVELLERSYRAGEAATKSRQA